MNERIKELADQVMVENGAIPNYSMKLFTEKFAELIVRECASLTLDYAGPDHYTGWLDYRDEIKKHFGVE